MNSLGDKLQQTFNEKNRDLIVNINGELVHRDRAKLSELYVQENARGGYPLV